MGRWKEVLPKTTQQAIEKAIETTKNYNNYFLTFLLAYNGTDEMLDCVQKIAKITENKELKITKNLIKENLWTKDLPSVDLVIRTGSANEPHLSNGMMMWDTADAQLYFSENFYPDFGPEKFNEALEEYARRQRRFGG